MVERVWSYRGEERANLMRILAIACFYAIELVNRHGLNLGFIEFPPVEGVDERFHAAVTALAVAWVASALGVLIMMRSRRFPTTLKYITTTVDVVLLTSILLIADGPRSPLVITYFIILAAAPLRFSAGLVRYTALATIVGYVVLVGDAWLRRPETRVPRYQQLMTILALALAGLALVYLMKMLREAAEAYAARREAP
ncbi:MAG: hypothetical protein DRJ42_16720 [Deltaproteobacteria bacterium]|nr:MAG: hypothetical protein DRJ42_16720 [Deltaproteobacteria bacterium]